MLVERRAGSSPLSEVDRRSPPRPEGPRSEDDLYDPSTRSEEGLLDPWLNLRVPSLASEPDRRDVDDDDVGVDCSFALGRLDEEWNVSLISEKSSGASSKSISTD